MATKPRPQHKRPSLANKLRALFKTMSQEELQDGNTLKAAVKKARIKVTTSDIYRIRKEFVEPEAPGSQDILKSIMSVKRMAEQVGGLDSLKEIISIIERVQQ